MFEIFGYSPLTWITFLPALGMLLILLVPGGKDERSKVVSIGFYRWITVIITFIQLIIAVAIFSEFQSSSGIDQIGGIKFIEYNSAGQIPTWISVSGLPIIGDLKIEYFIGIDGLSAPMILLTAIVCFFATFASWSIKKAQKGYFVMFLMLNLGMMGVFVALDFFLFYVFWELMLLPMYFLIGIWGGPRKEYAAIKFFLYTLIGSVFMLLVMVGLYLDTSTFNLVDMINFAPAVGNLDQYYIFGTALFDSSATMTETIFNGFQSLIGKEIPLARLIAFAALFIGFAIKVPTVPFHTWLPDAHVEAPTPISVILAGVLLKMGAYGMLRIAWPIFPEAVAYFQDYIAFIGMVSIVYGAMCALGQHRVGQRDFKKLIAYSSVSHMGYVLLGMSAMTGEGMIGAIFQMFNHGTITAMLFMIVGVIYDRAHTRSLDAFGGLANKMPVYTGIMTIAFFAAIGLPGMSGFISEVLVLLGAFQTYPVLTMISGLGIIMGAAYMLWALQKVFFGKLPDKWKGPWDPSGKIYKGDDMNSVEFFSLAPLAIIIIYLGINPSPMISKMSGSLNHLIQFTIDKANIISQML